MAPDAYVNIYRAYKAGTTKLTTWLVESARKVQADLSFLPTDPTSDKPIKVPVKHLTELARLIVDSRDPKITIPGSIIDVTRLAINLRRQACEFFPRIGRNGRTTTEAVNDGHRHFISVLKAVLKIIQPPTATTNAEPVSTDGALSNMFAALRVEEPVSEGTPGAPSKHKKPNPAQYELESSSGDRIFAILAFFKEANDIRDYLKSVWRDYRNGHLDLIAAAVTTDTAIALVKRSFQDISDAIPGGAKYFKMVTILKEHLKNVGESPEEFIQWLFADVANYLASYAAMLKPKTLPLMIPGQFGEYNPRKDRSRLSIEEKVYEDFNVLMEWLPEVATLSRARVQIAGIDELTTGLLKMMDANDIEACPPYAIVGTKIFLDIHHVLREDSVRPFDQMQGIGKRVIEILEDYFDFSRGCKTTNWHAQNDANFRQIIRYAKDWTQDDIVSKLLRKAFHGLELKSRPYSFLRNHPVLCGLIIFRISMVLQHGGITLCNSWGTVIYPAHLYNAARNSAGTQAEWTDMDYVISIHSPQRIFVGAPPPTEPREYLRRFLLTVGASASNFARNRRTGGSERFVESKKGGRKLKTTTPVRDIFQARYEGDGVAALTTPNIMAMLSVASKAKRTSRTSFDIQSFMREMSMQRHFSSLQMLKAVREGVAAEELHLLFDYVGLHQRGLKMLRTIANQFHNDLAYYYSQDYINDEANLPCVIRYIFEAVDRSAQTADESRAQAGIKILHKAANLLDQFVRDGENGRQGLMMAKAISTAVNHAYPAGTQGSLTSPRDAH